jgi:Domain of unknown function (DUF4394)
VRFRIDSPDRARTVGHIAGFAGSDTSLVGIDFRVQDGLCVDVNPNAGFDIFTRLSRGVAVSNTAFATFAVGDSNWLFRIDLLTGKALHVGRFDDRVVDIALDLDQ